MTVIEMRLLIQLLSIPETRDHDVVVDGDVIVVMVVIVVMSNLWKHIRASSFPLQCCNVKEFQR